MSPMNDEQLGQLLRSDAPAERDAMFRLSVLERHERKRFQRVSLVFAAAAAIAAIFLWIGFLAAGPVATFVIALLCAAIGGACLLSVPGVLQLMRRLRGVSGKS